VVEEDDVNVWWSKSRFRGGVVAIVNLKSYQAREQLWRETLDEKGGISFTSATARILKITGLIPLLAILMKHLCLQALIEVKTEVSPELNAAVHIMLLQKNMHEPLIPTAHSNTPLTSTSSLIST
jgi:hypothetical protein